MHILALLSLVGCRADGVTKYAPSTEDTVPADTDTDTDTDTDSGADDTGTPCTPTDWYLDADGDGFGVGGAMSACDAPAGAVAVSGDCNDGDAAVYPGAPVSCTANDGNCDGSPDDVDADGDHFLGCEECDDALATTHPGATERCDGVDNDCDGATDANAVDAAVWYADADADGYGAGAGIRACEAPSGYAASASDCDDAAATVHPSAPELCNSADDDCDGDVDENATDATVWNIDYDGDGFGSASFTRTACEAPSGYLADASDCNDANAAINPAATESCNAADDDCDGFTDEDDASDATIWYLDNDADGFGISTATYAACELPAGYAAIDTDCDDADAAISPAASEVCNSVDDDCDGAADDGASGSDAICAAESCLAILDDGSSVGDGVYWLDPDGDGDITDAWQAYCDMTDDGGGWTRLYGSLYPAWWDASDWQDIGAAEDDVFSKLGERADFVDGAGTTTWRLEVGDTDTWNTGTRSHHTEWSQDHDPFTESTDGSDYTFIGGVESTTCHGFNGLHNQYYVLHGVYCLSSDVDTGDAVGCWWMQIVPLTQYSDAASYPGYLEGYNGPNVHRWQTLWVR